MSDRQPSRRQHLDAAIGEWITTALLPAEPAPPVTVAEIRSFLKPTHTVLAAPDRAHALRKALKAEPLGWKLRIVESSYIPDGQAYVIDHEALGHDPYAEIDGEVADMKGG